MNTVNPKTQEEWEAMIAAGIILASTEPIGYNAEDRTPIFEPIVPEKVYFSIPDWQYKSIIF